MHNACWNVDVQSHFQKNSKTQLFLVRMGLFIISDVNAGRNFVLKDGIMLCNDYVVPYNKELLMRYNAHINVEICCQSMLIKYLFKYVNKRSDRCCMVLQNETNDEIQAYLNCRFICPYEAV
jgi:hypothetical protein